MATAGGAGAMREDKLGAIAPGFAADLVVYRLDCALVGAGQRRGQSAGVRGDRRAASTPCMVDGRIVVENRKVMTFDVDAMLREVRAMARSLRKRNDDLFGVADDIAEFVP